MVGGAEHKRIVSHVKATGQATRRQIASLGILKSVTRPFGERIKDWT